MNGIAQMVRRGPERRAQGAIGTQVPSSLLYKPPLQDEPENNVVEAREYKAKVVIKHKVHQLLMQPQMRTLSQLPQFNGFKSIRRLADQQLA